MERYMGFAGIAALIALCLLCSERRARFPWRVVIVGIALQFFIAWLLLRFGPVATLFDLLGRAINNVIACADAGSNFLFGALADPSGTPWGFVFAVRVLPVIVFFAALMSVLYHLGIMQRIVAALAWVLRRTLRVTGVEAMVVAANIFVGQTEAPLCIRPYIPHLTRSQLATLMVGGFATMAGSVMASYVTLLGGSDPTAPERVLFAKHLLTASVISAPAAFVCSKIIVPETDSPFDVTRIRGPERATRNLFDAAAAGATDGLRLALNVAAMLVAFVSLLALVDMGLRAVGGIGFVHDALARVGVETLSLELILGFALAPLARLIGIPWSECAAFGSLLGKQVVVTEFLAYQSLAADIHSETPKLSPRSWQIATYALCGFANFPSIAIQIGGLGALAPSRRAELASLGLRAMLGGAFACWMTACVAGILLPPDP